MFFLDTGSMVLVWVISRAFPLLDYIHQFFRHWRTTQETTLKRPHWRNLMQRFVQILRFVCVGNQTNLSLLLVSVDLFRIRHVKVCTGRLGLDVPPNATYSNVCMTAWVNCLEGFQAQAQILKHVLLLCFVDVILASHRTSVLCCSMSKRSICTLK